MKNMQDVATMPKIGTTRRRFYVGAINGMMGLITAALAIPAIAYLFAPVKSKKGSQWIKVGDISKLEPNQPVEMSFQRDFQDGWRVQNEKSTTWVVKMPDNQIVAFGPRCTHLGCAYHWDGAAKDFLCPCHTSVFSMDGKVVSGPAPRPLDRFETKVEGNSLLIGQLRQSSEHA
ncbi:MAG TPA: ubiquinol-cytochrome c reductase iron-sulfur subunit [Bryobacteraceae bacterium]|nr:ubiquinol-cytochrome c reductase iron-sulfur subunit [Bryobacteraceae bacterium]